MMLNKFVIHTESLLVQSEIMGPLYALTFVWTAHSFTKYPLCTIHTIQYARCGHSVFLLMVRKPSGESRAKTKVQSARQGNRPADRCLVRVFLRSLHIGGGGGRVEALCAMSTKPCKKCDIRGWPHSGWGNSIASAQRSLTTSTSNLDMAVGRDQNGHMALWGDERMWWYTRIAKR